MDVHGVVTYKDLYARKIANHHQRLGPKLSSHFISNKHKTILNIIATTTTTTTTIIPTPHFVKLVSLEDNESNIKLNKFADIIPFIYLHWLLVLIAILIAVVLLIIFICYCRRFITIYRTRREPLSNFYQYRTTKRRIQPHSIHQPKALQFQYLTTPPCPSKSLECLNYQFHQQDLNNSDSPQVVRLGAYRNESLSTFTSSTSYLPSTLSSRLSTRSFDPSLKMEPSYESQRVSMTIDDEPNENPLIIEIN
ncbi:unnamed protein product [Rotaria magnacalcarata]|uniref:Uncharacterized protein n=2 Tax=Rotaria magnacalcarata TaxID=392030 RepID=A0A818YF34_9BILA|nr:unnamed protein product [Rotaria magnacalcarata]CAF3755633.1 unnamed protein product [Rotaria magnacalcarata]